MGLFNHKTDEEFQEEVNALKTKTDDLNDSSKESRMYKVTVLKDGKEVDKYVGEVRVLMSFFDWVPDNDYSTWYREQKIDKIQIVKNGDVYTYPTSYVIKLEKASMTKTNTNNVIEIFMNDANLIKNKLQGYQDYVYTAIVMDRVKQLNYYELNLLKGDVVE